MVQPGVCYNGCCRSQPCMNGGTCVEHCHTPKKKFTCKCPHLFTGKICAEQGVYESCLDVLKGAPVGTTSPNGNYTIQRDTDGNYTVIKRKNRYKNIYCDFKSPNQAWTLIESFSLAVNNNGWFKIKAFHQSASKNHQDPNWEKYRMGYDMTKYIREKATMFRATCDFPKRIGSLTPDYLLGYLRDYDIINHGDVTKGCFKMAHMNVRRHDYYNITVPVWHKKDLCHLHISHFPTSKVCGFSGVPNSVPGEDLFGLYVISNNKSKCTATPQSTTQWWLGEQK